MSFKQIKLSSLDMEQEKTFNLCKMKNKTKKSNYMAVFLWLKYISYVN